MDTHTQSNRNVFGAVIFLKDGCLLNAEDLLSDFHRRWEGIVLVSEGEKANCLYFRGGDFHFAIEFRDWPVPRRIVRGILDHTLHRSRDEKLLEEHNNHFGAVASRDRGRLLDLACVFTKLIVSVLSVTGALAICWLQGSLLCPAQDFIEVTESMLRIGSPPLMLWINLEWKPKGHLVHSTGMAQFQAPELFLARQSGISKETAEYFFDLAYYIVGSGQEILDGDTLDGPEGVLKVESMKMGKSGKRGLFLVPVRPN